MKIIFLILLSFSVHSQHQHDHPAVHGMVVFGRHRIYLSHLPMFHAPHNYQAIIEVELSSSALKAYQSSAPGTLITLVPEKFSLPVMMANPRVFKAVLYLGHFERGGRRLTGATVEIKKIIVFRKLDPDGSRPEFSTYFRFGNDLESFLVHKISSRPDFDHLIKIEGSGTSQAEEIKFDSPDTHPVSMGDEIYFETGDLSH